METNQNVAFDPTNIPPIGGAVPEPVVPVVTKKPEKISFDNAPTDITTGQLFGKVFIGLAVGACVSALLFAVLSAIGGLLGSEGSPSGILGILLAVIGFIAGMIGSFGLAFMYNLFFSKRYYNLKKMFGLNFTTSIIIFVLFILIYFLFSGVTTLFTVLGIQIIFSLFITVNLIEFLAHPNYAASSLIGNTFGFILSTIIYLAITGGIQGQAFDSQVLIYIFLPAVVAYPLTILGAGIWDAIYYKFYEWGNNPFYLPSLAELSEEDQAELEQTRKHQEEVNVDLH